MFPALVKLFIAAVCVVVAVLLWRGWQDRKASPAWPSVDGTILQSDVRQEHPDPLGELSGNGWLLMVRYRYEVAGQVYEGNRVRALPERFFDEASARAALQPYPVGARVKVHHDPAAPASSVLQPG